MVPVNISAMIYRGYVQSFCAMIDDCDSSIEDPGKDRWQPMLKQRTVLLMDALVHLHLPERHEVGTVPDSVKHVLNWLRDQVTVCGVHIYTEGEGEKARYIIPYSTVTITLYS